MKKYYFPPKHASNRVPRVWKELSKLPVNQNQTKADHYFCNDAEQNAKHNVKP